MTWLSESGSRAASVLVGDPSRKALHWTILGQLAAGAAAISIQPPIAAFGAVLIATIGAITTNQMVNRDWAEMGWRGVWNGLRLMIPAIVLMGLIFYVSLVVILHTPPK